MSEQQREQGREHGLGAQILADESVRAQHGSAAVGIRLVGYDQPLLVAVALVLALFSFLYCFKVDHEEAQRVYFQNREEAFIEQLAFQGYRVPPELLRNQKGAPR